MAIEMESDKAICCRCGLAYGRRKGNFPVCYSGLYKGSGYLPVCKNCVDTMYNEYCIQIGDTKKAVRQMCRKLDLYWNEQIFDSVEKKATTRTMMTNYIARINNIAYAGKSYDDTLTAEGSLWTFRKEELLKEPEMQEAQSKPKPNEDDKGDVEPVDIPEEIIRYWGPGYTPDMYQELEQRLQYYRSQMDEAERNDIAAEALLRQIAMMEIDINRARAEGRQVDKMVNSLNSLISSLRRPRKEAADTNTANTPFGVWIKRWEDEQPVPEIDESMKDVDGIARYVLTWVTGHLAHMLKLKNVGLPLYEAEMQRLRVERPEYDDEDDESLLSSIFGGDEDADASG